MNTPATSPLRYLLSSTMLTVQAALRLAVVADERGGHLEPEVVVALSSRDRPTPAASAARVPIVSGGPSWSLPGSLRRTFDRAHPRTAALAADLSARAEQYLAGLRMGEKASEVITFGRALEVVHRELAAADQMRREWIAGQGREVASATWDLGPDDLVRVEGSPRTLPGDLAVEGPVATALAGEYGVLVAALDSDADAASGAPAAIGVYRRAPATLPDGAVALDEPVWRRDDRLAHLHLVDPSAAPAAPARARVPFPRHSEDPWVAASSGMLLPQPDCALEAIALARTQLELLEGSDEYARLAATHNRTEELCALEHEARLAGGLARRG